jgi:anti-sigma-K factor RskA
MYIEHISPEDLALHAMHALSPEESAIVDQHIATCAQCQHQIAEMRGDMALLAFSVEQHPLPEGATERFMQRVAAHPNAGSSTAAATAKVVPFEATAGRRRVWPVLVPWAAAAALAAVCISIGIANRNLRETITAESGLLTSLSSKASHAQQIVDVLNAPAAQRVTLTLSKHSTEPSGQVIYLADRGALLFEADNLKPLDPGKTYELWVIPADGNAPLPAGVFKPDNGGYATVVLPQLPQGVAAKAFGVTVESDPGSQTPTSPIILSGS